MDVAVTAPGSASPEYLPFVRQLARQLRKAADLEIPPAVPAIAGESGQMVMLRLPFLHIAGFANSLNDCLAFTVMSLFAALRTVAIDGDYAQFGVHSGLPARFLTSFVPQHRKLQLFDNFAARPQDEKGAVGSTARIPRFNPHVCRVHDGWFKDTIPRFAVESEAPLAFLHFDTHLYAPTVDALFALNARIACGTVLVLDEYATGDADQEHRALIDWASLFGRRFDYLWRTRSTQVAVRITA